ncbi:hypothetical protein ACHAQJ_003267 [Trichoderma viride]
MDKGKSRANSRSSRHSGSQNQSQHQNRQHEGSKKFWTAAEKMTSAKAQLNDKRLVTSVVSEGEYLGQPPADRDLIEARFVTSHHWDIFPGKLEVRETLDGIRKLHHVWIVADLPDSPSVFKVFSESVAQLQQAIDALNQRFHDLRLSKELLTWVNILQKSSRVTGDTRIRFEPYQRPLLVTPMTEPDDVSKTAAALLQELRPLLQASTKCLTSATTSDIKMRVSFGGLRIVRTKKDQATEINYDEFTDLMKWYSRQGGLPFCTRFKGFSLANNLIKHMLAFDGDGDLRLDHESKRRTHTLMLSVDGKELLVEDWTNDESALSRAKIGSQIPTGFVDWIVSVPDHTCYDWSLHAETYGYSSVPADLQELIKGIEHRPATYEENDAHFLRPSEVIVVKKPAQWKYRVSQTRLKTSFIAEFRDSPYMLEISITQEWEGLRTDTTPEETIWQVEFYGKHWDSAMNQINPVDQRKDWGEGLKNVWIGTDPDLMERFSNFLRVLVQVQRQLDVPLKGETQQQI